MKCSATSVGTAQILPSVQKIFNYLFTRLLWSDPCCTFLLLSAQTTIFYNLSPSLCPFGICLQILSAKRNAHWMFWWKYPCCAASAVTNVQSWRVQEAGAGPGLVSQQEFLRHQSFPVRWWHWGVTGGWTPGYFIIRHTSGATKTALHPPLWVRLEAHLLASFIGSDTLAQLPRPREAVTHCGFQTNAFMPHFTFFARMLKNADRDNSGNKRIMFVPRPRRKPAQQSQFLEYPINKNFYFTALMLCFYQQLVNINSLTSSKLFLNPRSKAQSPVIKHRCEGRYI